jgi:hypothetical protein
MRKTSRLFQVLPVFVSPVFGMTTNSWSKKRESEERSYLAPDCVSSRSLPALISRCNPSSASASF